VGGPGGPQLWGDMVSPPASREPFDLEPLHYEIPSSTDDHTRRCARAVSPRSACVYL
jgi:hypothetical protein